MKKQKSEGSQNLAMLLDDLQNAWGCLQESVLYGVPSEYQSMLLNQINEGTRWDKVYDLSQMQKTFQEFTAMVQQINVDSEVKVWIRNIQSTLKEALVYLS